jgi:hypothetical protein
MTHQNTLAVIVAVRGNEKPQAECLRLSNIPATMGFLSGVPYGARTRNLMFHSFNRHSQRLSVIPGTFPKNPMESAFIGIHLSYTIVSCRQETSERAAHMQRSGE